MYLNLESPLNRPSIHPLGYGGDGTQALLEAEQRGLWKADPDVLDTLKNLYLEIEGWMEERMDGGADGRCRRRVPGWIERCHHW